MIYDITDRVLEAWRFYDGLLDKKCDRIAELSGVDRSALIKMNPADFVERNRFQKIRGYKYQLIRNWIVANKTDETFLISPLDADEETAEQISYKARTEVTRKIRASKCEVLPIARETVKDFCIRNHRQTAPNVRQTTVAFGLVYEGEIVAIMNYDVSNGAIRGRTMDYELVRLAIAKGTQVHGGASKLQKACEDTLRQMGVAEIYSYSNATINNGGVYKQLGFTQKRIERGQPHVIMKDNSIERLISLHPYSTDEQLALRGLIKFHLGGNCMWKKNIAEA